MDKHTFSDGASQQHDAVVEATREWLLRAVIGLNLCPFAKAVQTKNRIRYVVSEATELEALCADLERELNFLNENAPEQVETTLLIHPYVLTDFLDYNDFLDVADALIESLQLEGEIQIASFHPDYQFADTAPQAIENYSNRSPYPMLQLLRESSIESALASYPDAAHIYDRNIATLRAMGMRELEELGVFTLKNRQDKTKKSKK